MAWNVDVATARIKKHLTTAPEVSSGTTLAMASKQLLKEQASSAANQFPRGRAHLVEGVHLYGQLLDFENLIVQDKRETEASHTRVLQFLHANYKVWDAIVDNDDAIRVDYHGPRLHVVLDQPTGDAAEQIKKAVGLSVKLEEAAKIVGKSLGFPSRLRFGIDHGRCLAMSTGRSHERDVLFLGPPANYAAKLVAAERIPGIYLTENASRKVGSGIFNKNDVTLYSNYVAEAARKYQFSGVTSAASAISSNSAVGKTKFQFHRKTPPLATIDFSDLNPANSIRMGMASIFADIDGFTNYVDNAIRGGETAIRDAVQAIHVLREELNSVLKQDFGGKRVRFIGDCIQGVIAEGRYADDTEETVLQAVLCASAMKSSFVLAKEILRTIDSLDLAIGIEFGDVPLTRLGARGSDSIRCAASLAVTTSEKIQQQIEGGGIRLGERAHSAAAKSLSSHFRNDQNLIKYPDAATLFGSVASPAIQITREFPSARPYQEIVARITDGKH